MGAGKLLRYLPKPTSFSIPNKSSKNLSKTATGFSGPIASTVPREARREKKNFHGGRFDTPEPASPKISCTGQVKHKNRNASGGGSNDEARSKKKPSVIRRMFTNKERPKRPPVGKLRRFASGREMLADFDWRKEVEDDEAAAIGGGTVAVEKRKEVNLWKRRMRAPPVPLEVPGV